MARLHGVIQRLITQQGIELFFQSGAMPVIRTATASEQVLRQNLDASQIVAAFIEIVPEHLRARFPVEGSTRWTYDAPSGRVRVQFIKRAERVSVSVRPVGAGEPDEEVVEREQGGNEPAAPPDAPIIPGPAPVAGSAGGSAAPAGLTPQTPVRAEGPAMPIPRRAGAGNATVAPLAELNLSPSESSLRVVQPAEASSGVAVLLSAEEAMSQLLEVMLERKASDLHLSSGSPPMLRVDGEMRPEPGFVALHPERLQAMLWSITPEKQRRQWEEERDADFAHEIPTARFRVNLFMDRKGIGAVLRHIPSTILTAEKLGLSKPVLDLCSLTKGLVLVTGPTGSGKSTTLAAMIDHINRTRDDHILTIEDPIEFQHPNRRCLVNQREVGTHTKSFKQALRAALREDPDVVLVGELRDLETIAIAIETAETGHLVFGTLHTNTAPSTVDRIIDQFPPDRQAQVRTMLSESLRGVVAQTLCKKIGGGRVAAHEILLVNGAVSNVIREGKTFQLPSLMQTGRAAGNSTLNDALVDLVKKGIVEPQEALKKAVARAELRTTLERLGHKIEAPTEPTQGTAA